MQRKSNHIEISDPDKPLECPVVKRGYLDIKKQSHNTERQEERHDPREPLKHPVVERGYWGTTDQSENTEIQEEKKYISCNKIMLCALVASVLAVIGLRDSIQQAFGLFFILIIFLAILLYRIIQK